ncbi:MAG: hypothetical protein WBG57_10350 [Ornithinimicrobium sp.]
MRWTRLFDDLEAQLVALEQAELEEEVAESTRSQRGSLLMLEALTADVGRRLRIEALGIGRVEGHLTEVGSDWCMIETAVHGPARRRSVLMSMPAIQSVTGLSGAVDQRQGVSGRRFDMRSALRALARDRAMVRIHLASGTTVSGTIDRVGRDHIDLADHPEDAPRRASAVRHMTTVPTWALCALRQV